MYIVLKNIFFEEICWWRILNPARVGFYSHNLSRIKYGVSRTSKSSYMNIPYLEICCRVKYLLSYHKRMWMSVLIVNPYVCALSSGDSIPIIYSLSHPHSIFEPHLCCCLSLFADGRCTHCEDTISEEVNWEGIYTHFHRCWGHCAVSQVQVIVMINVIPCWWRDVGYN